MCEFIRANRRAGPVYEMHLSREPQLAGRFPCVFVVWRADSSAAVFDAGIQDVWEFDSRLDLMRREQREAHMESVAERPPAGDRRQFGDAQYPYRPHPDLQRRTSERLAEYGWKPHRISVAQNYLSRAPIYRYMREQ